MLKVKLWRHPQYTINMQVLEQGKIDWKYVCKNGVTIASDIHPEIFKNAIYVRGYVESKNNIIAKYSSETPVQDLYRFKEALLEYGAIIVSKDYVENNRIPMTLIKECDIPEGSEYTIINTSGTFLAANDNKRIKIKGENGNKCCIILKSPRSNLTCQIVDSNNSE